VRRWLARMRGRNASAYPPGGSRLNWAILTAAARALRSLVAVAPLGGREQPPSPLTRCQAPWSLSRRALSVRNRIEPPLSVPAAGRWPPSSPPLCAPAVVAMALCHPGVAHAERPFASPCLLFVCIAMLFIRGWPGHFLPPPRARRHLPRHRIHDTSQVIGSRHLSQQPPCSRSARRTRRPSCCATCPSRCWPPRWPPAGARAEARAGRRRLRPPRGGTRAPRSALSCWHSLASAACAPPGHTWHARPHCGSARQHRLHRLGSVPACGMTLGRRFLHRHVAIAGLRSRLGLVVSTLWVPAPLLTLAILARGH